jgi:hypothetical protein
MGLLGISLPPQLAEYNIHPPSIEVSLTNSIATKISHMAPNVINSIKISEIAENPSSLSDVFINPLVNEGSFMANVITSIATSVLEPGKQFVAVAWNDINSTATSVWSSTSTTVVKALPSVEGLSGYVSNFESPLNILAVPGIFTDVISSNAVQGALESPLLPMVAVVCALSIGSVLVEGIASDQSEKKAAPVVKKSNPSPAVKKNNPSAARRQPQTLFKQPALRGRSKGQTQKTRRQAQRLLAIQQPMSKAQGNNKGKKR